MSNIGPSATAGSSAPAGAAGLTRLAAAIAARLHAPANGRVCDCGPCRHQLLVAAARLQIAPDQVLAALTALAAVEAGQQDAGAARVRRPLQAQVGASARVLIDGGTVSLAEGLLALAAVAKPPLGSQL